MELLLPILFTVFIIVFMSYITCIVHVLDCVYFASMCKRFSGTNSFLLLREQAKYKFCSEPPSCSILTGKVLGSLCHKQLLLGFKCGETVVPSFDCHAILTLPLRERRCEVVSGNCCASVSLSRTPLPYGIMEQLYKILLCRHVFPTVGRWWMSNLVTSY